MPLLPGVPGFVVQFGINGDPAIQQNWSKATFADDKVTQGNTRGFVSFAKSSAPNSRATQIFINYADNSRLNRDGFAPFGKVISGMENVDKIFSGYGQGPMQGRLSNEGNALPRKKLPQNGLHQESDNRKMKAGTYAHFETSMGNFTIELFEQTQTGRKLRRVGTKEWKH